MGKPLIAFTIEQAIETNLFEQIVVSTDSDQIAEVATKHGADVFFKRQAELASDTAGKLQVIQDAFNRSESHYGRKFDFLIDLDATAPLRKSSDIKSAFQQFIENRNDNLFSATSSRRSPYFNVVELDQTDKVSLAKELPNAILRRQDAPKTYDMNASIYIWKREILLNGKSIFLENTGLYVMPEERSIDIDSELDYRIVEMLLESNNAD